MPAKRKKEWFDDDTLWRELYPALFPEKRFAEAAEQAGKLLELAQPPGNAVLDLCCGPGRFAIALARAGMKVTGVDRTRYFLDKARARARAAKVKIEWVQADMRDFVRPGAFDLVVSMFTSFGYFDDKQKDLLVLGNMVTSLKPGGVCLIEVMGKERLAVIFQPTGSDLLPDGSLLVQRREIFDEWTRVRNGWILIRKGRAKHFKFHHTIYSGQELRDRLEQAGLAEVKLYGSLHGEEYGRDSERLIAVGRKRR